MKKKTIEGAQIAIRVDPRMMSVTMMMVVVVVVAVVVIDAGARRRFAFATAPPRRRTALRLSFTQKKTR